MIKMTDSVALDGPGGMRRTFIRHPSDIPIEVTATRNNLPRNTHLRNMSLGGIAFSSHREHRKGDQVLLRIPIIDPAFKAVCEVMWCHHDGISYEVGARFSRDDDLYRLRMVEQLCHIEHYHRQVEAQTGRKLSANEAAQEWIAEHAGEFPTHESLGLDRDN
jgi:hypothetical protein